MIKITLNPARTLVLLNNLYTKYDARAFGQVMQLILSKGFSMAGYKVTYNQIGVPDFIAVSAQISKGYAVEVKTSGEGAISLSKRDLEGVTNSGYTPVVAILNYPDSDPKWYFIDAVSLVPIRYKMYSIIRKPNVIMDFDANSSFRESLLKYYDYAMEGKQALRNVIR